MPCSEEISFSTAALSSFASSTGGWILFSPHQEAISAYPALTVLRSLWQPHPAQINCFYLFLFQSCNILFFLCTVVCKHPSKFGEDINCAEELSISFSHWRSVKDISNCC